MQQQEKAAGTAGAFCEDAHAELRPAHRHRHCHIHAQGPGHLGPSDPRPADSEHENELGTSQQVNSGHRVEWSADSEERRELCKSRFLVLRQFIPRNQIQAAVITEHVTPSTCYFSLQLLLKDAPADKTPPAGSNGSPPAGNADPVPLFEVMQVLTSTGHALRPAPTMWHSMGSSGAFAPRARS